MFWAEIWKKKNIRDFYLKIFYHFLEVKFSIYLIKRVFMSDLNSFLSSSEILSTDRVNKYIQGYSREILFYHENVYCVYILE